MDNVEVYKCGQKYTWKSAIKFENALMRSSSVTNSAIYEGLSPGVIIKNSNKVTLENNVITGFAEHGVWVQNSVQVNLHKNWVFHVI